MSYKVPNQSNQQSINHDAIYNLYMYLDIEVERSRWRWTCYF
ncbi:hypothetical protein SD457_11620 [Coprobacillaceae bacterium CR2/5/TPMF4]|nr:hypothetical protein SD457_11620 [Coprobacillaceae bacterium CR2/5/TPMF4]